MIINATVFLNLSATFSVNKDVYVRIKLPQRLIAVVCLRRDHDVRRSLLVATQRRGINGMGVAQSTIN